MPNKKIRLRFATEEGLTSRLIKYFSHGEWSHVDIIVPGLLGYDRLVGARLKGGVLSRPMNYGKFVKTHTIEIPVTDDAYNRAIRFLLAQVGKPYDWTAIAAFAMNRTWSEDDSWFCSELAAAVLQQAGALPTKLADGVNKITPSDLTLMLSAMGYE